MRPCLKHKEIWEAPPHPHSIATHGSRMYTLSLLSCLLRGTTEDFPLGQRLYRKGGTINHPHNYSRQSGPAQAFPTFLLRHQNFPTNAHFQNQVLNCTASPPHLFKKSCTHPYGPPSRDHGFRGYYPCSLCSLEGNSLGSGVRVGVGQGISTHWWTSVPHLWSPLLL